MTVSGLRSARWTRVQRRSSEPLGFRESCEYRVVAFSELVEPSGSSQGEGPAYRQRILLIVGKLIAEAIFHPGELQEIDWESQT